MTQRAALDLEIASKTSFRQLELMRRGYRPSAPGRDGGADSVRAGRTAASSSLSGCTQFGRDKGRRSETRIEQIVHESLC
ncbi:hypothetical protein SKAU_G00407620 [Synaphobranchus kaupii]|uniref:Uncharacterized protein n=1 Tax=Synaphobranchus kaupii TaxID=118154 RepID=A0A9Q1EAB4_SYNKA|nr:hypothetical protein SKAU_G00407620 [Synaphobranchus kaupii]